MTCPDHHTELEPCHDAPVAGGLILVCPVKGCHYSRMPERKRTPIIQPKLPHIDPGRQSNKIKVKEKDLQQGIVDALRLKGYDVLVTTVQYRFTPCMHCQRMTRPQGGYRASKGVPDLLVWIGFWKGLECKGTDTAISPEQKKLVDEGKVTIVRSIEEALEAVGAAVRMDTC